MSALKHTTIEIQTDDEGLAAVLFYLYQIDCPCECFESRFKIVSVAQECPAADQPDEVIRTIIKMEGLK